MDYENLNIDDYINYDVSFDERAYANYKLNNNQVYKVESFGAVDEVIPENFPPLQQIGNNNEDDKLLNDYFFGGDIVVYNNDHLFSSNCNDVKNDDTNYSSQRQRQQTNRKRRQQQQQQQKNFGERFSDAVHGTYYDMINNDKITNDMLNDANTQNHFEFIFVRDERWKYNLFILLSLAVVVMLLILLWISSCSFFVASASSSGKGEKQQQPHNIGKEEYKLIENLLLDDNVKIVVEKK